MLLPSASSSDSLPNCMDTNAGLLLFWNMRSPGEGPSKTTMGPVGIVNLGTNWVVCAHTATRAAATMQATTAVRAFILVMFC
jgi:hypothetical protein